jgi:hypothetical protein
VSGNCNSSRRKGPRKFEKDWSFQKLEIKAKLQVDS